MADKQCSYLNRINAFVDNELSIEEYQKVKKHLSSCSQCQQELRDINRINNMLDSLPQSEPSDVVVTKILGFSKYQYQKNPSKWLISGSIAASFIIGLLLSSLTFSTTISNQNNYQIGNDSFYSYFIGDDNVQ